MFNQENIAKAKEEFQSKRYAVIDNILEPRYINALYKAVPEMPYGVWGCIGNSHRKYPAGFRENSEKFQSVLDGHIEDVKVQKSLEELGLHCQDFHVLGVFEADKIRDK